MIVKNDNRNPGKSQSRVFKFEKKNDSIDATFCVKYSMYIW